MTLPLIRDESAQRNANPVSVVRENTQRHVLKFGDDPVASFASAKQAIQAGANLDTAFRKWTEAKETATLRQDSPQVVARAQQIWQEMPKEWMRWGLYFSSFAGVRRGLG